MTMPTRDDDNDDDNSAHTHTTRFDGAQLDTPPMHDQRSRVCKVQPDDRETNENKTLDKNTQ